MEFPRCLTLLLIALVFLMSCSSVAAKFPALFAFGDSILDTGNNNLLATFSKCNVAPYGMSLPLKLPTGRFGNGKVFSDVLTEKLGIKDELPAFSSLNLRNRDLPTGVCFASGGSGLDDLTAKVQGVIPLGLQLNHFKQYFTRLKRTEGDLRASTIVSKGFFLISAGNNDFGITKAMNLRPALTTITYTAMLIPLAKTFVRQLYELGARKIGFMGTLPLGCLPGNRAFAGEIFCNEIMNMGAKYFNSKLEEAMGDLQRTLPGADIFYIDVYNPLMEIVRNYERYGFKNPSIGCCCAGLLPCPKVEDHVFWDIAHPTEKAYRIMLNTIIPKYSNHFTS
ncbi:GDSL esterase/lipase EXL4-like [Euphorbia lathyris]|uniref:GDSL esterase/lipase EXL4-like n=1 Tax=Euphorbia lathyris TaxID=212925 RepID=UPI0033141AD2